MNKTKLRTLVLNADFLPMSVIDWQRAFSLWCINQEIPGEGLEVVEFYDDLTVRSAGGKDFPIPCVCRVPYYINRNKRKVPYSRKNIYIRDNLTCQYCCKVFDKEDLTLDHVVPRITWKRQGMKGTPSCWENIVTCCFPCNSKKADKSLKEAGMQLMKGMPKQPSGDLYVPGITPWSKNLPPKWVPYIKSIYKNFKFGVE